jgi:hypothetical protein
MWKASLNLDKSKLEFRKNNSQMQAGFLYYKLALLYFFTVKYLLIHIFHWYWLFVWFALLVAVLVLMRLFFLETIFIWSSRKSLPCNPKGGGAFLSIGKSLVYYTGVGAASGVTLFLTTDSITRDYLGWSSAEATRRLQLGEINWVEYKSEWKTAIKSGKPPKVGE